jgi:anti-sigma factor RsiW
MACPDELTLDLWLAGALPPDESATVAAHARTCPTCTAAEQRARSLGARLHAALDLDPDERAYLRGLDLAARWRTASPLPALPWAWIALAGVVCGYVAWAIAAPMFGSVALLAVQVVLGTAPLYLAVGQAFGVGLTLLDLARHPALDLSQPLLALVALALLLWPRQSVSKRRTQS